MMIKMNEEELYKLAISDVSKYSLLNEILAIRDNRFPDEENDYTIKVYGSISLDVLNRYVRYIDRLVEYQNIGTIKNLKQLQNNWNELKQWLENHWQESQDIWFVKIIGKMQEMENSKDD